MKERMMPVVLVVSAHVFSSYILRNEAKTNYGMSREEAMKLIINLLNSRDIVISTTGKLSRELYEYREIRGDGHGNDFLTVGSMGHASSIAMGVAVRRPDRRVFCFDGDGSAIMHMGAFAIIGQSGLKNFIHVIFNNGAHDSVGGQPTVCFNIDIPLIVKACGYREALSVSEPADIEKAIRHFQMIDGPALLEIRIRKGARSDLGRPKSTPLENRDAFMTNLGSTKQEN
jgi:phosphonopyruvate decarboxylase